MYISKYYIINCIKNIPVSAVYGWSSIKNQQEAVANAESCVSTIEAAAYIHAAWDRGRALLGRGPG